MSCSARETRVDKNSPTPSPSALIVYFSLPRWQTVKTPSQKDVLSFVGSLCVCVCVDSIFQMSLFVTLTFKRLPPLPLGLGASAAILGPWRLGMTVCPLRVNVLPLNGFFGGAIETCCRSLLPPPPEPNQSWKWKWAVAGSGHRRLNQLY